ncbi:uncharacterized protein [Macrobrachium rosenbergii]|uniref:uncharacterized protein n=1 Tax=Macrobrachium rosenbergii TaxID=79674 RepID=UPI0034D795BD
MDLSWKPKIGNTNGVSAGQECPVNIHEGQRYPSEPAGARTSITKCVEKGYPLQQGDNRGLPSKIEHFSQGYVSVSSDSRQNSPGVKRRISLKKSSRSGIWAAALPSDTESTSSENEGEEDLNSVNVDKERNEHRRMYLNETENDGDDENSDTVQEDGGGDKADKGDPPFGEVRREVVESASTDCEVSPYFAAGCQTKECFTCKVCDKMIADRNIYRNHIKQCRSEKHKCLICCRTYARMSSLKVHMKVVHTNEKPYLCDICGQTFGWAGALNKHMASHSQLKLFTCEKCGKSFANSWNLKSHAVVHDEEKPYQCEECGRKFLRLNTLRYHKKTHTNERPFQCDVCGRTFTQPNSLKTHQKVHSVHSSNDPPAEEKVKKYGCELCGRMFALKNTLNVHMMRHRGERPHKCLICQKSFTQSSTLNIHMRTHTGDKPYACDICGMQFTYNYALQKHVLKHGEMGEAEGGKGDFEYDDDGDNVQENAYDDETIAANQKAVEEIKQKILQTLSKAKAGGEAVEANGDDYNHDDSNPNNDVNEDKVEKTVKTEVQEKTKKITPNDFLAVFQSSFQTSNHSE